MTNFVKVFHFKPWNKSYGGFFKSSRIFVVLRGYFSKFRIVKLCLQLYYFKLALSHLKPNRGQQLLSRAGQIKICQGQNFNWFLREKENFFGRAFSGAGSLFEKTEIYPLWSTAAGVEEVVWLQKTNRGPAEFHFEEVSGLFLFHNTIKDRFYERF